MSDKIKFSPIRGTEADIQAMTSQDGNIYFATDTGHMFIDTATKEKFPIGGASTSGIYYTDKALTDDEQVAEYITLELTDVGSEIMPSIDSLVLSTEYGIFYRVTEVLGTTNFKCQRLTVSGSGGGGGGTSGLIQQASIALGALTNTVFLYGQNNYINVTPKSAVALGGVEVDTYVNVHWKISVSGEATSYIEGDLETEAGDTDLISGQTYAFNFGEHLFKDKINNIVFSISGANSGSVSTAAQKQVKCVNLQLLEHEDFKPLNMYEGSANLVCTVEGNIEKCLEFWFDDVLVETKNLSANASDAGRMECTVDNLTHGVHTVEMRLYQLSTTGEKIAEVDSLKYEIAAKVAGDNTPIIWLGNYESQYNNYDQILIPYMAFDPTAGDTCSVRFYKDATEEPASPLSITFTSSTTEFVNWEITDATIPTVTNATANNSYYITCGNVTREISFAVKQTGIMVLAASNSLKVKFDAAGRSNNESTLTRGKWSSGTYTGVFEDFNWYNNGWLQDSDDKTCLRISNGAKFSIPVGKITFNSTVQGSQSQTFEFEFKIRNVQNYSHLIKLVTRYTYTSGTTTIDDEEWYNEYKANWATTYDSYDQYLQYWLPTQGMSYDNLVFKEVESGQPDINQAFCQYYDGTNGFGLGTQDSFFKTNSGTLNVNYVEDRKVHLALVYSRTEKLVSIFLNGVLSGSAYIADESSFTVNTANIVFSSDYCDIDLYKFRYYNTGLSISEILNNYAVDNRDLLIYNQSTSLSTYNSTISEYQLDYNQMIIFNEENPDNYLMPYFVFSDVGSDALPYSKADAKSSTMTFVNTGLDRLYETGDLGRMATEAEYPTHTYPIYWIKAEDVADALVSANSSSATANYYVQKYKEVVDGDEVSYEEDGTSGIDISLLDTSKVERSSEDGYYIIYRTLTSVENYYLHHGASFEAKDCEIKVQGTSSQFYPRRNYKAKCKKIMMANRGPFEADPFPMDWFYMDNDSIGTNKFTLKIDYMESSGSYNTGFANLVANAYTKHPLDDYSNALTGDIITDDLRTSVQGFPTMAFHKKSDGTYIFIGRYNMNIDKGSDECYGFKLFEDNDLYEGSKISTNFVKNSKNKAMKIADAAECWEFSDNNRGFCSFRDPNGRKITEIGDGAGDFFGIKDGANNILLNAKNSCPIVADSFEYRYNADGDLLDYLYNPADATIDTEELFGDDGDYSDIEDPTDQTWRNNYLFNKMKNWEKVCKWVWSTCTDEVDAESSLYETYAQSLTPTQYYIDEVTKYSVVNNNITTENYLVFAESSTQPEITKTITEVKAALTELNVTDAMVISTCGPTVRETTYTATDEDYFEAYGLFTGQTYVSYTVIEGVNTATYKTGNLIARSVVTAAMHEDPTTYSADTHPALSTPYPSADNPLYYFDTKEYRLAKFKREFTNHFDKEYALVYFVMTEVFMCYDSRGKNCMMASWGPKTEGGDYIWYPIFYDIDTQLGINNTGIPSFEYYVNATEDGCFSTNDSVLWGNIYQCFFDDIKAKYQALRTTINRGSSNVNTAPLAGIDYFGQDPIEHIENWYNCDPTVCNSLCMLGARPLIMKNFDEYYKYISIMNTKGAGYQGTNGKTTYDESHSFLYALQGDRSLSRQQFLARRINFVDSWLCQGNYLEGTGSVIKFRTSANDPQNTSDCWVENTTNKNSAGTEVAGLNANEAYYEDGTTTKRHYLDADFYINLTPYQRSYVTLATDNSPLPSIEYEGTPVAMQFPSNVITGIRKSPQYAEQLLYVYGADYLKDIGDVSLLYPREFELNGATHLSRIILGNDTEGYKNNKVKAPKFDAGISVSGTGGKPLLKEVVFTNARTDDSTDQTFDFSSSEKLQIFRALGMNLAGVKFADGVALHTLHLPDTITELTLKEARNLTTLITSYTRPTKGADGNWVAEKGLYIEGLTDVTNLSTATTNIDKINIAGGSLGYNSYILLNSLYQIKSRTLGDILKISITDFNWSPYSQIVKGTSYDASKLSYYYVDDGHYGFTPYNEYEVSGTYSYDNTIWTRRVANGLVYYKDPSISDETIDLVNDNAWTMLKNLATVEQFINPDETNNSIPRLTGEIYINNTDEIDENYVRNILLTTYYPDLNIHMKTVKKAYSAQFISLDSDGNETIHDTYKMAPDSTVFFNNPYSVTELSTDMKRQTEDFKGWSTQKTSDGTNGDSAYIITSENWSSQTYTTGQMDYKYYAVYETHKWNITYKLDDSEETVFQTVQVAAGTKITLPTIAPARDSSSLDIDKVWMFRGYALNKEIVSDSELLTVNSDNTFNKTAAADTTIYLLFTEGSVYDNVIDEKYLQFGVLNVNGSKSNYGNNPERGLTVCVKPGYSLSGKITLPLYHTLTADDGFATSTLSALGGIGTSVPIVAVKTLGFRTVDDNVNNITHVFFERETTAKPSKLFAIGLGAFANDATLVYCEILDSVAYIGDTVFNNTKIGTGVTGRYLSALLNKVEYIGDSALAGSISNKPSITELTIPGTVYHLGSYAFQRVQNLSKLYIGSESTPIYIPYSDADDVKTTEQTETVGDITYYWGADLLSQGQAPSVIEVYCSNSYLTDTQVSEYVKKKFSSSAEVSVRRIISSS